MVKVTALVGALLIVLGISTYSLLASHSPTALIPAVFGVVYLILALAARQPERKKHAMHIAAALSLVGVLATAAAVGPMVRMLGGGVVDRPAAVWAKTAMALLCLVHLLLAARSFVIARVLPPRGA